MKAVQRFKRKVVTAMVHFTVASLSAGILNKIPQWHTADAEIIDQSVENPEL